MANAMTTLTVRTMLMTVKAQTIMMITVNGMMMTMITMMILISMTMTQTMRMMMVMILAVVGCIPSFSFVSSSRMHPASQSSHFFSQFLSLAHPGFLASFSLFSYSSSSFSSQHLCAQIPTDPFAQKWRCREKIADEENGHASTSQ